VFQINMKRELKGIPAADSIHVDIVGQTSSIQRRRRRRIPDAV
jgi:hypothetical protein